MSVEWLLPWYDLTDLDMARALERQRACELARGHVLEGQNGRCIARRDDTDDALFALDDGRIAEVHLTWRQTRETDPVWPHTAIFPSLDLWARTNMHPPQQERGRPSA